MTRTRSCEAFATLADVYAWPAQCGLTSPTDDAFLTLLIDQASDMLAYLSGGRVTGRCRATLWPTRATDACLPERRWMDYIPEVIEDGFRALPLWGPNLQVFSVVIDGVVVSPAQYKILDGYRLVRLTGEWPTSNDLRAADGAVGTFTVTIQTGESPDEVTRQACVELVIELATDALTNGDSNLPAGAKSTNLQGVSVELEDRADAIRDGASMLPKVLRFLAVHAAGGRLSPTISSPGMSEGWTFHTRTGASGS